MVSIPEVPKPEFLRGCLVCNKIVSFIPEVSGDQSATHYYELFVSQICPSAREELAAVETICPGCRGSVDEWSSLRQSLRQLHATLVRQYKSSRRQRCAGAFTVAAHRSVVHIPYSVFLAQSRNGRSRLWSEAAHEVALAALETAGIPRADPTAGVRSSLPPDPVPAPTTATVACQTLPGVSAESSGPRCSREGSPDGATTWVAPTPLTSPRCRLSKLRRRTEPDASADVTTRSGELAAAPPRTELGRLRGWEGITNVQPSAPPRPALKRVGFEGLKEQRARDLEETLSILSVADTASLLDRTETLSVFSDTAELGTLAEDHLTSLDLSSGKYPSELHNDAYGEHYAKQARGAAVAPSVSFAEPSAGAAPSRHAAIDKGEDLLREFAETMSNISEGVILEDLEGYFEEIDRPSVAAGRAAPPSSPAGAADSAGALTGDAAASCAACRAVSGPLPSGGRQRCQFCRLPFTHLCKLRQHVRLRHADRPHSPPPQKRSRGRRTGRSTSATARPASEAEPPASGAEASRAHRPPSYTRDADGKVECGQCGRSFSRVKTLRLHQAVHAGGGYPCTHCHKVFPSKSELQRHADSHRPDKSYKCQHCDKTFQISTSLARHLTLHTGHAAGCPLCGRRFDRKDSLVRHLETHTSSNAHPCQLCGKLFKQRRVLAKHVRLMHSGAGVAAFPCPSCEKTFRTRYERTAHGRRMHGSRTPPDSPDTASASADRRRGRQDVTPPDSPDTAGAPADRRRGRQDVTRLTPPDSPDSAGAPADRRRGRQDVTQQKGT